MTITSSNFYQSSYYQIQKSQWGALEFYEMVLVRVNVALDIIARVKREK